MFEFSVSKDMRTKKQINNDKRRIPAYLLTLIVKELKIRVEHDRVINVVITNKHEIS